MLPTASSSSSSSPSVTADGGEEGDQQHARHHRPDRRRDRPHPRRVSRWRVDEEVKPHKREVVGPVRTAQLVDSPVDGSAKAAALVRIETAFVGLGGLAVQPAEHAVAIERASLRNRTNEAVVAVDVEARRRAAGRGRRLRARTSTARTPPECRRSIDATSSRNATISRTLSPPPHSMRSIPPGRSTSRHCSRTVRWSAHGIQCSTDRLITTSNGDHSPDTARSQVLGRRGRERLVRSRPGAGLVEQRGLRLEPDHVPVRHQRGDGGGEVARPAADVEHVISPAGAAT